MATGVESAAENLSKLDINADFANSAPNLKKNLHVFSPDQIELAKMLLEMRQSHLFEHWPEPGIDDEEKKTFFAQRYPKESAFKFLKFKAFVRSRHPTVAMVKIFEKRVEKNDREHRMTLPSDSNFGELPSAAAPLVVRDEKNTPWNFDYTKSAGKSYLGGQGWINFVKSKGIEDGNRISLSKKNKDDYTIKVIKN